MPEIDVIHVYEWTGRRMVGDTGKPSYTAEKADGSVVFDETEDFGVEDLAWLATEYGVSRWAERGDTLPDHTSELILVGWADAPIARDDVEIHRVGYGSDSLPAVNIKVYDTDLPKGDAFKEVVEEHDLDTRLAALSLTDLRDLIDAYIEKNQDVFYAACEDNYDQAKEDAIENIFVGRDVKIHQEGRSGGWTVVDGLPDIEAWDAKLLGEWDMFQQSCKGLVADIPRAMVWNVLANRQDELAGRVVRVELTMVLTDGDLDEADADPTQWDWRAMLDLDLDSEITVRKIDN